MAPAKYSKKPYKKSKRKFNKKSGHKASAYPDKHNFKMMAEPTWLMNLAGTPASSGSINGTAPGAPPRVGPVVDIKTRLASWCGSFLFSASRMPSFNAQSILFDRYKVNKIKLRIIPQITTASASFGAIQAVPIAGVNGVIPVMRIYSDYDDTFPENTLQSAWARRGRELRLDKEHTISFVPRVNYFGRSSDSGSSPALIAKCPWINCNNPNINLYGLKYAIKDFYLPGDNYVNNQIKFEITYYLSFKEQQNLTLPATIGDYMIPSEINVPDTIDGSGNIYDPSGNLILENDGSGNIVPV